LKQVNHITATIHYLSQPNRSVVQLAETSSAAQVSQTKPSTLSSHYESCSSFPILLRVES